MKKTCVAMLLAGGQGSRLYALTRNMAKPAVPFGGKYRIIDFTLSNCVNSGIDTVGVLTQYRPLELNGYLGSGAPWDLDRSNGGLHILPPYTASGDSGTWYKGTANAIYQNMDFIESFSPEHVLILSGDHIYQMDYSAMLRRHIAEEAACTISVLRVPMEDAPRFGIMNTDENLRITEFEEKPKEPKSDLASMGIYIFRWDALKKYLVEDEADADSAHDFGKNLIPAMLERGEKLTAFPFEGYWKDVGTIRSYWDANMDLLPPASIDLGSQSWPMFTSSPSLPPLSLGSGARVTHSLATKGGDLRGEVSDSVLFHSVTVEDGASVRHSVLMPGVRVRRGARVEYAVLGAGAEIGRNAVVGADCPPGEVVLTTCGASVRVADGAVIAPGAMLYESVEAEA